MPAAILQRIAILFTLLFLWGLYGKAAGVDENSHYWTVLFIFTFSGLGLILCLPNIRWRDRYW